MGGVRSRAYRAQTNLQEHMLTEIHLSSQTHTHTRRQSVCVCVFFRAHRPAVYAALPNCWQSVSVSEEEEGGGGGGVGYVY